MKTMQQRDRVWRFSLLAAAAAAVLVATPPASAQVSPRSGEPIAYSADRGEFVQADRRLVLSGNAELLQGQNRVRANAITLAYGAGGSDSGIGDVERIEASGDVYFVTPTQVARGDQAVYTASNDTLVVTGDVILTQGESVLNGSRLTIHVGSGRSTMEGGAASGRRVQGVFYPGGGSN